jgi:hypothetical protein
VKFKGSGAYGGQSIAPAGVSMIIILFAMITSSAALIARETRGKSLVD